MTAPPRAEQEDRLARSESMAALVLAVFVVAVVLIVGGVARQDDGAIFSGMVMMVWIVAKPCWRRYVDSAQQPVHDLTPMHEAIARPLGEKYPSVRKQRDARAAIRAHDPGLAELLDVFVPCEVPEPVKASRDRLNALQSPPQRSGAKRVATPTPAEDRAAEARSRRAAEQARVAWLDEQQRERERYRAVYGNAAPLVRGTLEQRQAAQVERERLEHRFPDAGTVEHRAAVKVWQEARGLTADGILGPKTRTAMQAALEGAETVMAMYDPKDHIYLDGAQGDLAPVPVVEVFDPDSGDYLGDVRVDPLTAIPPVVWKAPQDVWGCEHDYEEVSTGAGPLFRICTSCSRREAVPH